VIFLHQDGRLYFETSSVTRKARNARRSGTASLLVQGRAATGRSLMVAVEGTARVVEGDEARSLNERLRAKYLKTEVLDAINRVWGRLDDVAIEITPQTRRSWTGAALHDATSAELDVPYDEAWLPDRRPAARSAAPGARAGRPVTARNRTCRDPTGRGGRCRCRTRRPPVVEGLGQPVPGVQVVVTVAALQLVDATDDVAEDVVAAVTEDDVVATQTVDHVTVRTDAVARVDPLGARRAQNGHLEAIAVRRRGVGRTGRHHR
jgi:hypothetical protein